jgi:hypothetical protein
MNEHTNHIKPTSNIMSYENKEVNIEQKITIQRSPHNKENPYVMISKKMLRDPDLSPRDKGALAYMLSLPDTWVSHSRQIAKTLGIGIDQMRDIFRKLIKFGYATREEIKDSSNKFLTVNYYIFEERLENPQKIKEKIPKPCFPDTGFPVPGNPTLLSNNLKENIPKEEITPPIPPQEKAASPAAIAAEERDFPLQKPKKIKPPIDFPPEIRELAERMVAAVHLANPHWLIPKNLHPIMNQIHEMITTENRKPEDILNVFMWAITDSFWSDKLCKPNPVKYLREKFPQLAGKMNEKPATKARTFAPCSDDDKALADWEANRKYAL